MKLFPILALVVVVGFVGCRSDLSSNNPVQNESKYPRVWFAPVNDPNKPDWEILPQERQAGEVILSKRNELGKHC